MPIFRYGINWFNWIQLEIKLCLTGFQLVPVDTSSTGINWNFDLGVHWSLVRKNEVFIDQYTT